MAQQGLKVLKKAQQYCSADESRVIDKVGHGCTGRDRQKTLRPVVMGQSRMAITELYKMAGSVRGQE